MKSKIKQRNCGFSLIELLVVVVIIAIVGFAAISGIGMLSGWKMKQCTLQLDSAIGETQLNAMSKGACELEITRDSEGNYYMQMIVGADKKRQQKQKIADEAVTIYYVGDDVDAERLITKDHPITISFDKSSGAYKPIETTGTTVYCKKLVVRMGERVMTIKLVKDTGRHYIE